MTSSEVFTFVILNILLTVYARPSCKLLEQNNVVCTAASGQKDYILQRGLVSDNNQTVGVILKKCHIIDVDHDAFKNIDNLRYIDLSENKISRLKLGVLDGNRDVTYLNLSYNVLSTLPKGLFDQKPNLNTLDLKANKLILLERGLFEPIHKLSHLDLSSNSLFGNSMETRLFDKNRRIKHINFSRNNMVDAPDNILDSILRLDTLNLDRCSLKQVPLFATRFNLKTMKQLILSGNQINRLVDYGTFIKLDNLELLNLAENVIDEITGDVFKTLKKLKSVILRNNRLMIIPVDFFLNMRAIWNVDLSYNLIQYVPITAFRGTSLKNLNLSHNRFSFLDANFGLTLRNSGVILSKFYFNDNPWQCACLIEILKEVKTYNIRYNSFKYNGAYAVCVTLKTFTCQREISKNAIFVEMYDKKPTIQQK